MTRRAGVYIDGQNFHRRLAESCENALARKCEDICLKEHKLQFGSTAYKRIYDEEFNARAPKYILDSRYMNFLGFIQSFTQNRQIEYIKYFTALFPKEIDSGKHNADHSFFERLREKYSMKILEGRFLWDKKVHQQTGEARNLREKGVDVKLCINLIDDSFYDRYDDAYIFSQDSDLLPALEMIKANSSFKDKKLYVVAFNKYASIEKVCDLFIHVSIERIRTKYYQPAEIQASLLSIEGLSEKFSKKI